MECAFLWNAEAGLVDGGGLFSLANDFNDSPGFLASLSVGRAAAGSVFFMGIIRLDIEYGNLAAEPLSRSSDFGSGCRGGSLFRFFSACFPPLAHMLNHNKKGWHQ